MQAYRIRVKDWARKGAHSKIIKLLADFGFAMPAGCAYAARYEKMRLIWTEITALSQIENESIDEAVSMIYAEFPDDELLEVSYEVYERKDMVKMPRCRVGTSRKKTKKAEQAKGKDSEMHILPLVR